MLTIILKGRIPSKKNSKQVICRGKYPMIISNARFQAWNEEQLWLLKKVKTRGIQRCEIVIKFRMPDKRRTDLTNKAESVLDLLVDSGILIDDNCQVVPKVTLEFESIDTVNPGATIELTF